MENLTSNLRLTVKDNNRFQLLYVGQSYSTLYALFGRFIVIPDSDYNPRKVRLQSFEIRIVNYKGPFNLGIDDFEIKINKKIQNEGSIIEEKGIFIKVNVKIDFDNSKGSYIKNAEKIIEEYGSFPVIENDSYLIIDRTLVGLNNQVAVLEDTDIEIENTIKYGIFDEEFYYRNGKRHVKTRKNGDFKIIMGPEYDEDLDIINLDAGGGLCKSSIAKISVYDNP
ncbi:hypothetical protein [Dokdonia sp.]|uniref:hypothetical protein n=1 Tax=Dokdonia sp. TaxID=2024995 RepID=UPI003267EF45